MDRKNHLVEFLTFGHTLFADAPHGRSCRRLVSPIIYRWEYGAHGLFCQGRA
jgi:hypothetical protein